MEKVTETSIFLDVMSPIMPVTIPTTTIIVDNDLEMTELITIGTI